MVGKGFMVRFVVKKGIYLYFNMIGYQILILMFRRKMNKHKKRFIEMSVVVEESKRNQIVNLLMSYT